ncbi:speriolin isoform X3 [Macrotis lagotis]|uniref:speriolin isoform X3 n=1 Tax=Macrotis lagotis TaxID=92651 RepID=UPI003D683DF5
MKFGGFGNGKGQLLAFHLGKFKRMKMKKLRYKENDWKRMEKITDEMKDSRRGVDKIKATRAGLPLQVLFFKVMSLLSNYEELRKQIERLIRENESLKKLVRLIQENHDLKSAIKTQGNVTGASGISSMFGEVMTGSAPQANNCVNSPSAQVSTNGPDLGDLGILSSLAGILSNPQPNLLNSPSTSPTPSPLTGPLPYPLNSTIPGSVTVLTNYPLLTFLTGNLNNQLTSPKATSPNGTLVNPLPSYMAAPSSYPAMGSETAPMQASTFDSIETGPLSGCSTSPLTVRPLTDPTNNPLTRPSSPALSVSSPQTCSIPASKTIPPTRKLSFLLPTSPSTPMTAPPITSMSSALTGSLSSPPGNLLPSSMVNNKLLTDCSRPQSPLDASCQRSSSPATSANIPASSTRISKGNRVIISTDGNKITMDWEQSSDEESSNMPFVDHPMQTSTPLEPSNKNLQEMERKMAHQNSSKFNDTTRDPKQLTWERLVGEIAFQLDRRILSSIFPERVRLYGFTISNISEKIIQASLNTSNQKLDEELCQTLTQRYVAIMNRLQSLGYNWQVHPGLTEQLVNAYGILRERPELAGSEGGNYTMDFLQRVVMETVPPSILNDALLLLSCLNQLSQDDGKPMFIW